MRVWSLIGILVILLVGTMPLRAEEAPQILIITSDASVEKYRTVQEEFQNTLGRPTMLIDLGDKKWDMATVEEFFYDEEPDVIYCIGSKAYLLAEQYAPDTALLFSSVINWLRLPLTDHTYGVSNELHAGMELMLFRYIFPQIQRIGVLYSPKYTEEWFKKAKETAQGMQCELIGQKVSSKKKSLEALEQVLAEVDAFWLIPDPEIMSNKDDLLNILERCDRQRIPVFSYHEAFAPLGVALVISVDDPTIGRQAAGIAVELLDDASIDEPVQFPAGSHIVLNLKQISAYGLSYNEDALGSVNTIIE